MVKLYHLTMSHDIEETERLITAKDEHNDSKCRGFWCQLLLSLFGILFLFTGIIMADLWPQIFNNIMKNKLELENNTLTYQYWKQIPAPLHMSVYLFNWTNPEATLQTGDLPILQQLGPYVFKENRTKVNITFNNNETITYMQLKSWEFEQSLSNGSLSDNVTTINIVINILGEKLQAINKHWIFVLTNYYLKLSNINKPYITRTAGELIFDGYDDALLDVVIKLKPFFPIDLPFKKVGWLYGMNMSTSSDGLINMFTGKNNIENVGLVHSVNYNTKLNVFKKDCSYSNASAGDLWPEHTAMQPNMSIYIPGICSAITMQNNNHTFINGLKGIEFVAGSDVFNNTCYCPSSGCPLPGVRPLSLCGDNSLPIFISFPHFYLADKSYRQSVVGMNPNRTLHEFKIILENDYSIPLKVDARLQFNVKVKPIKDLKILKNMPEIYLPVFWFSESFKIPQNMSDQLLIVTNVLPIFIPYVWLILALAGCVMLILSTYLWVSRKNESFTILDPL
ncbi:protein croquemort-like [Aphis craccivora]|uniref:Protein croquemort-like n=1 Tax=Aphis craccivora TaxID=307492 RepID=A0A6G0ZNF1_APHCR|nr:protein croquemort-like [Aphis craccivora]